MSAALASLGAPFERWYVLEVSNTVRVLQSLDRKFGDAEPDKAALVERCMQPCRLGNAVMVWSPRCEMVARYKPRGQKHETMSTRRQPLFPGYVFARFSDAIWPDIIEANGVMGVLRLDGKPCVVADAAVERLHALLEQYGGLIRYDFYGKLIPPARDKRKRYDKGQALRITGGAFVDFMASYIDNAAGDLTVDLDIFGRTVRVSVPEALAVPA